MSKSRTGTSNLSKVFKNLKDYAGTAANASIVLITSGVEQITTVAVYRCPCVELSQLGPGCNETTEIVNTNWASRCSQTLNYSYGLSFIFAPAFALLIFSAAANPKLWKSITGCCQRSEEHKRKKRSVMLTLFIILIQSCVSPITWICVALLDGQYLACSITTLPYRIGGDNKFKTCEEVSAESRLPFSNAFQNSRSYSQVVGAISIVCLLFVGSVFYCISQCIFPLTYFHAKYFELYRQMEISEFEDEMTKKAQVSAERNVQKFLKKRRNKKLWDRISAVFQFHRDEKNLALYSQLHEWVVEFPESDTDDEKGEEDELKTNGSDAIEMEDLSAAVNA